MSIVDKVSATIKRRIEKLADGYDARTEATGIGDESHRRLRRLSLWDGVEIAHLEIEQLQAFKDFVHKRLDEAGIPTHPDGEHSKAGCRIGDRLDIVFAQLEKARKWDELQIKIGKYYEDEDDDDNEVGLDTIGEIAAHALGYL